MPLSRLRQLHSGRRGLLSVDLLLLLLVVALASCGGVLRGARGENFDRTYTFDWADSPVFVNLYDYGFLGGGSSDLSGSITIISATDSRLWLLLCRVDGLIGSSDIYQAHQTQPLNCSGVTFPHCQYAFLLPPVDTLQNLTVANNYTTPTVVTVPFSWRVDDISAGVYYILGYACFLEFDSIELSLSGTCLNPHGEHLDAREIPLKYFYIILTVVWLVIIILWLLNYLRFPARRILLHTVITIFPIMVLSWSVLCVALWWSISSTGDTLLGLLITYYCARSLVDTCFFNVILLVAKGWGIESTRLGRYTYFYWAVTAGSFVAEALSYTISFFFGFMMTVLWCLMIAVVLISVKRLIYELQCQSDEFKRGRFDGVNKFEIMLNTFKAFRVLVIVYVIIWLGLLLLESLVQETLFSSLSVMLQQILSVVFYSCLMVRFRLQSTNTHYIQLSDNQVELIQMPPADPTPPLLSFEAHKVRKKADTVSPGQFADDSGPSHTPIPPSLSDADGIGGNGNVITIT